MWPTALPTVLDLLVPRSAESDEKSSAGERQMTDDLPVGQGGLAWDARGLLVDVLRGWPRQRVLSELQGRVEESTPLWSRLAVLELLSTLEGEGLMDLMLTIADGIQPVEFASRRCSGQLENALASALQGDSRAYATLSSRLGELEPGLLDSLAPTLARGGRGRDVQLLIEMLDRGEALDQVVLAELAALRWRSIVPAQQLGVGGVVSLLDHEDPRVRKLAALALGRLHHAQSFQRLVELLADREVTVARSAAKALRDLSGLAREADAQSWLRWEADEWTWLTERAPRLADELRSGDATSALRAARELGSHPLYRDQVANLLVAGLTRREPGVVRSTCSALQRLGALCAAPELVELLYHEDDDLASGARNVLETLAGEQLGTDPRSWLAWVAGRPH